MEELKAQLSLILYLFDEDSQILFAHDYSLLLDSRPPHFISLVKLSTERHVPFFLCGQEMK